MPAYALAISSLGKYLGNTLDRDSALVAHIYDERNPAVKKLVKEVMIKKAPGQYVLNRNWVGRDAHLILRAIGIDADESIRCIIFEGCKNTRYREV